MLRVMPCMSSNGVATSHFRVAIANHFDNRKPPKLNEGPEY